MSEQFGVVYTALWNQRTALEAASFDIGGAMESAHGSETGVQAPVGRTGLRESLEGTIGSIRAQLRLYEDDVTNVATRLQTIESQVQDLDVSLGSGWEEVDR